MTIASDILSALQKVGTPFTIYKPAGTVVTGEYLDPNQHTEHTTPAIRGFFFDFMLHEPTQVVVGDVIAFSDIKVVVTAIAPDMFQGSVVNNLCSGYRVNATGSFSDYTQAASYDSSYNKSKTWVTKYATVYASMMDRTFRSQLLNIGQDSVESGINKIHLYISDYYTVETGMRWTVGSDKYKVEQIERANFPGIKVVFLSFPDNRA